MATQKITMLESSTKPNFDLLDDNLLLRLFYNNEQQSHTISTVEQGQIRRVDRCAETGLASTS